MKYKKRLNITIIGGGSSTHVLIPFLSGSGHSVNLLTRHPSKWSNDISSIYQLPSGEIEKEYYGNIDIISDVPKDVIPKADVIILCMPVSKYRTILHTIAPYIRRDREIFIGFIYGQGGVNWMVEEIKQGYDLNKVAYFSVGLIPWICRTIEYGKRGVTYGPKHVNIVAVTPKKRFEWLNEILLNNICMKWFEKGAFQLADNYLSLTLSVDNQIIHPSRCYGLSLRYGGKWNTKGDVPFFYRDYDILSANLLSEVDIEYSLIRDTIKSKYINSNFEFMLDYLALERLTYNSQNTDIVESFTKSSTLTAIRTPVVETDSKTWIIDKDSRFFSDDIHYGLCIAKWFAEQLGLNVPTIDRIIDWAQKLLNEKILDNNRLLTPIESATEQFHSGIPSVYGFKSIDQIIELENALY